MKFAVNIGGGSESQCKQPRGWIGRFILRRMNASHSNLTDWGLNHISINAHNVILDVGCGGGKTISKLAASSAKAKVYGIDYSETSVAFSRKTNARRIHEGRVEIHQGSVSEMPFPDAMFDLATAVETHFWWPDLPLGMREILRVLQPGGTVILIAEIYKGAETKVARIAERVIPLSGMNLLSPEEHRAAFTAAGFSDIQMVTEAKRGWICCVGKKPSV